ncbi:MAG: response regulator [Syntrophobacteraceae bacterium]|nr:response regulator [Syntrophobacteraceae bacterium]
MNSCKIPVKIILADDDPDDQYLVKEAFANNCPCIDLQTVNDGQELMDYLSVGAAILPGLILLDANMPRMGGLEALKHIKSDPKLTNIPIIIFTTSGDKKIVRESYCDGANSFIRKPNSFDKLSYIIDTVSKYWCEIVSLPDDLCPVELKAA